jgi:hypothetical protein
MDVPQVHLVLVVATPGVDAAVAVTEGKPDCGLVGALDNAARHIEEASRNVVILASRPIKDGESLLHRTIAFVHQMASLNDGLADA